MKRLLFALSFLAVCVSSASAQYIMSIHKTDGGVVNIDAEEIVRMSVVEPENHSTPYEYVDLGLSVKWATYNIGATRPEEIGGYYAWGETTEKYEYTWDNYKFGTKGFFSGYGLTKYCCSYGHGLNGFEDGKHRLDPEDDVAHVLWGGNWRMPTFDDVIELYNNCDLELDWINGVEGFRLTSKVPGYTGNSVFFPFGGYSLGVDLVFGEGRALFYWTSESDFKLDDGLYWGNDEGLIFDVPLFQINIFGGDRSTGLNVRAVCP